MVFSFSLIACNDEVSKVNEVQITDLKDHNMKIIPENPASNDDIKLVVFDDCTYNKLSGINKNGKNIEIQKQFNSMMKWACFQVNDTISLGKLSEGIYTVNYKLIDVSAQISSPIAMSFYFNLIVAQ
ncbi:MAG TPA: hypothetical protein DCL77_05105 [Prolixibacteraceae bacterium]|nr:hypothetical protein [Prolixibacteraceae bacterium]